MSLPTPVSRQFDDGRRGMAFRFVCSVPGCSREHWVRRPPDRKLVTSAKDDETVTELICTRSLAAAEWTWKNGLRRVRCDIHSPANGRKPMPSTAAAPAPPTLAVVTAAGTKAPTIKDRQRIAAALDEVYLVEQNRYKGLNSDQKLAGDLNVPRLWVEEVRALLYGTGSGNEAAAASAADIAKLKRTLDEMETRVLGEFDKARDEIRRIEGRLG